MTRHDSRAGLYVPLRLVVDGLAPPRVRVTFTLPSSLMAWLGSAGIDSVARGLDPKVERILREVALRGNE